MREYVDFHHIDPHHGGIHDRLINWARWCYGTGGRFEVGAMFVGVKSTDQWEASHQAIPVDQLDGLHIEKAVRFLPDDHRDAVRWSYVYRTPPAHACRSLGCTAAALATLVKRGRQMLINRGA